MKRRATSTGSVVANGRLDVPQALHNNSPLMPRTINHPALQIGTGLIPVVGRRPITEQRLTEEVERIS